METEELGSVYESLLELQPQFGKDGKTLIFASDTSEQMGNQRKTTGSYYTPDSLVQMLLDTALDPVLDKTEAESNDPEKGLLSLTVIDPACGSGHFLLAAARRIATRLARIRADGTPSQEDFRHALRDAARSCIHGVDRNPMAVELTKVALWIETVDPGLPLGFFDLQILCGDSLIGVFDLEAVKEGIPDAAYTKLAGDDNEVAKYYRDKNRREKLESHYIASGFDFNHHKDYTRDFELLRDMPEETVGQIIAKKERFCGLKSKNTYISKLKAACDLYVSAFFVPKTKGGPNTGEDGMPRRGVETVTTSGVVSEWVKGVQLFGPLFEQANIVAQSAQAFHWPLAFPDIMEQGGFDVVVGNPPWERIKLQEREFFAARDSEIANAPNAAARRQLIAKLATANPGSREYRLFEEFMTQQRQSEAVSSFVRVPGKARGRFLFTGIGDVNTYALFAELFLNLLNSRGRAGIVVPTGIATDATTALFFENLCMENRVSSLFDFENRERFFPNVTSGMRFCLLTLGPLELETRFAFFLTQVSQVADQERNFKLSQSQIAKINPNTKTLPTFRTKYDAKLTTKIFESIPILQNKSMGIEGDPWGIKFSRLFDMAGDSELFQTASELEYRGYYRDGASWVQTDDGTNASRRFVPLYESKMVSIFNHRHGDFALARERTAAEYRKIPNPSSEQLSDPCFEVMPRYWVCEEILATRLQVADWRYNWLVGWRDITGATKQRTLIPCILPSAACNHKFQLMMPASTPPLISCLYANLCSLTADFIARQKVGGTSFSYFTMCQIPILPPSFYIKSRLTLVTEKILELTYTSHSLAHFARDLGYLGSPFSWNEERRANLQADLDAFYARAYGLSRDELRYILDPVDLRGPNYPSETFRVLKETETRNYGEYRTRRLVLDAWDRMEANGEFRVMEM